jgi:hypothetical protein
VLCIPIYITYTYVSDPLNSAHHSLINSYSGLWSFYTEILSLIFPTTYLVCYFILNFISEELCVELELDVIDEIIAEEEVGDKEVEDVSPTWASYTPALLKTKISPGLKSGVLNLTVVQSFKWSCTSPRVVASNSACLCRYLKMHSSPTTEGKANCRSLIKNCGDGCHANQPHKSQEKGNNAEFQTG